MRDDLEKHYSNEDLTVVWKPGACQHSKICWTNLRAVFDPQRRPWIDLSHATTERIVEQVNACPSGALSILPKK